MLETSKDELAAYYQRLVGQRIRGRYELVRFIKAGGSSGVYEGVDRVMERRVAVKVLYGSNPMMASRFEREALTLSRLRHPNTLTVFDFGTSDNGYLFMIMEYLQGRTLKEVMRAESRMNPQRSVAIISQMCRSLAEAHRIGVVHRDVKPSNICLVSVDGNPEFVKVLDFGVAKVLHGDAEGEPELTQMGRIIGTPRYMSPEQIGSTGLDGRADIYSTAIVLYEMLCGRVPFDEPGLASLLLMHLKEAPPQLSRFGALDVPHALEAAVMRALAKRPEDRFESADAFREAIESAVGFTGEWSLAAFTATELPRLVDVAQRTSVVVPQPPPVPDDSAQGQWTFPQSAGMEDDEIALAEPADDLSVMGHVPEDAPTRIVAAGQGEASAGHADAEDSARVGVFKLPAPSPAPRALGTRWLWVGGGALAAAAFAVVFLWPDQHSAKLPSSSANGRAPGDVALVPGQRGGTPVASAVPASAEVLGQRGDMRARSAIPAPTLPSVLQGSRRVHIVTEPAGAAVWDGNERLGTTPLEVEVDGDVGSTRGPWKFVLPGHHEHVEARAPSDLSQRPENTWTIHLVPLPVDTAMPLEAEGVARGVEPATEEPSAAVPSTAVPSAAVPSAVTAPSQPDVATPPGALAEPAVPAPDVDSHAAADALPVRKPKRGPGSKRAQQGASHLPTAVLGAFPSVEPSTSPLTPRSVVSEGEPRRDSAPKTAPAVGEAPTVPLLDDSGAGTPRRAPGSEADTKKLTSPQVPLLE